MTFEEFCNDEGIVEDERNRFRKYVNHEMEFPKGTDVDKEDIEEDDLGDMYDEFVAGVDEEEEDEDF